jgi:hypothetical protein
MTYERHRLWTRILNTTELRENLGINDSILSLVFRKCGFFRSKIDPGGQFEAPRWVPAKTSEVVVYRKASSEPDQTWLPYEFCVLCEGALLYSRWLPGRENRIHSLVSFCTMY